MKPIHSSLDIAFREASSAGKTRRVILEVGCWVNWDDCLPPLPSLWEISKEYIVPTYHLQTCQEAWNGLSILGVAFRGGKEDKQEQERIASKGPWQWDVPKPIFILPLIVRKQKFLCDLAYSFHVYCQLLAMLPQNCYTNHCHFFSLCHHQPYVSHHRIKISFFNKAISTDINSFSLQGLFSFLSQDICTCYSSGWDTVLLPLCALVSL